MEHRLVAFFSASGNTAKLAETLAVAEEAALYEIRPAVPYSRKDLNRMDKMSRSTLEMRDKISRPELADRNAPVADAHVIFLGFPIWWGQAPRILSTFVESRDFDGITVIPFFTSGSSDIGQSDDSLAAQAGSGKWLQGRRFPGSVSDDELQEWITEMIATE